MVAEEAKQDFDGVGAVLEQSPSQVLSPEEMGEGVGDGIDWDALNK